MTGDQRRATKRGIGFLVTLSAFLFWESGTTGVVNQLLLPLVIALGAYLIVENLLAIAVAIAALAGIHGDLTNPAWIESRAYPAVALTAAVVAGALIVQRFRERVETTRDERRSARQARAASRER